MLYHEREYFLVAADGGVCSIHSCNAARICIYDYAVLRLAITVRQTVQSESSLLMTVQKIGTKIDTSMTQHLIPVGVLVTISVLDFCAFVNN